MSILTNIFIDFFSSIKDYWHIWAYGAALAGQYAYYRKTRRKGGAKRHQNITNPGKSISTARNIPSSPNMCRPTICATITAAKQSAPPMAHWQRLTVIVDRASERTQRIGQIHSTAGQHLDTVEIGLNRLLLEISQVMPLPIEPSQPGLRLPVRTPSLVNAQALAA